MQWRIIGNDVERRADAGDRFGIDAVACHAHHGGHFKLAGLRRPLQERLGTGQLRHVRRVLGAAVLPCGQRDIAQLRKRVAQRGRLGQQVILQALVRQAQQEVVFGERRQPVVQVAIDGAGA